MVSNNEQTSISSIGEKVVVRTGKKVELNASGKPVVTSKPVQRSIPNVSAADFVQALREAIDRAGSRQKMATVVGVTSRTIKYWQIGKKMPPPERMAFVYDKLVQYMQVHLPEQDESPVELIESEAEHIEEETQLPSLGVSLIERRKPSPFQAPRPIAANRRKK